MELIHFYATNYILSFPYADVDPAAHNELLSKLYVLLHDTDSSTVPIGYMLESTFNALAKVPVKIKGELEGNHEYRFVKAFGSFKTEEERSKAVAGTVGLWREKKTFKVLDGWRDELYPVYGADNELLWSVERSASSLFGIVT